MQQVALTARSLIPVSRALRISDYGRELSRQRRLAGNRTAQRILDNRTAATFPGKENTTRSKASGYCRVCDVSLACRQYCFCPSSFVLFLLLRQSLNVSMLSASQYLEILDLLSAKFQTSLGIASSKNAPCLRILYKSALRTSICSCSRARFCLPSRQWQLRANGCCLQPLRVAS